MKLLRSSWPGRLLGISEREVEFSKRGFQARSDAARAHLEGAGRAFVFGYNTSLGIRDPTALASRLREDVEPERQGFAFEGAGMGLKLLGLLLPWRAKAYWRFLHGPASAHTYMDHVGAGWALSQLGLRRWRGEAGGYDRVWHWLVADGMGFHAAFFRTQRYVREGKAAWGLSDYARRVFDQGVGRCLWFVYGTDPEAIAARIGGFEVRRRSDLWSGAGLACAYAGAPTGEGITEICEHAGSYRPVLAQGVAFAAKARHLAGIPARHTERACEMICGMSGDEAARLTDITLSRLPEDSRSILFERWRVAIQDEFREQGAFLGARPTIEEAGAVSPEETTR